MLMDLSVQVGREGEREAEAVCFLRGEGLDDGHNAGESYTVCFCASADVPLQIGPNRLGTSRAMCTECQGHGEKLREKDRYACITSCLKQR